MNWNRSQTRALIKHQHIFRGLRCWRYERKAIPWHLAGVWAAGGMKGRLYRDILRGLRCWRYERKAIPRHLAGSELLKIWKEGYTVTSCGAWAAEGLKRRLYREGTRTCLLNTTRSQLLLTTTTCKYENCQRFHALGVMWTYSTLHHPDIKVQYIYNLQTDLSKLICRVVVTLQGPWWF